jgi:hypothetical protein
MTQQFLMGMNLGLIIGTKNVIRIMKGLLDNAVIARSRQAILMAVMLSTAKKVGMENGIITKQKEST